MLDLYWESRYLILIFLISLLLICTAELISAPNIITFLPNPLSFDYEKLPCASNRIPQPEYLHLSGSAFLVSLTAPNKEYPNTKYTPWVFDHKFIL